MRCSLLVLITLCLAFAPAPWPKPDRLKVDLTAMQGDGRALCATHPIGDPPATTLEDGEIEVVIASNLMTFTYLKEDRETYQICPGATKRPKTISLRRDEVVVFGIYSLEGDTLTLCTAMGSGLPRPTDISTAGEGQRREVFRRMKR